MGKRISKKQLRKVQKLEKKIANKARQHAKSKGLQGATNTCVAVRIYGKQDRHSKAIMTRSGAIGRPGGVLIGYDEDKMPWANLEPAEEYEFINCAEASMYLRVVERHSDPSHYRVTSYDSKGGVNPPCGNCSQWVYETFGDVVDT